LAAFFCDLIWSIIITNIMLDTSNLEDKVQDLIVDICKALYFHGFREIPVGAIMRLIGVENETATRHDEEYFRLDAEFEALLQQEEIAEYEKTLEEATPPPGTTLH
jgi:hypothetical protein